MDSDSQTKRVEFLCRPPRGPSALSRCVGAFPFSGASRRTKSQRIRQLPNEKPNPSALRSFVAAAIRRQVWLLKPSLRLGAPAPIRDGGEGTGHKWSRNRRRGGSCDSPPERQSRFGSPARSRQAMAANALIPHDGSVLSWPRPAKNGCERRQSIIAALRMQIIVACAGFPLRLRMRWGISQR